MSTGTVPLRIGAIVQCTASDLYPSNDPDDYCIDICKRSGLFDEVVLAVPDAPESVIFDELAARWQVGLVKGAVYNVAERMLLAAERYSVDIIARVLLRRFYLDTDLVRDLIRQLRDEQADYIRLPRDFNYELAADVFTRAALSRAVTMLRGDDPEMAARRFSPWRLMDEDHVSFKTVEHPGSADYPRGKVVAIKDKLGRLLAENQVSYGWQFPASAYAFAGRFLRQTDVVLDIASGQGDGSRQLAQWCAQVVGVDNDEQYVSNAARRFADVSGLSYLTGDAMTYCDPQRYDAIVCMHTLEHLPRPLDFLRLCRQNLKSDGRLLLEVPLLLPRPLGEPLNPHHSKEYRREELERLLGEAGFRIDRAFGRDRNAYTCVEEAHEALHYHCSIDATPLKP